MSSNLPFLKYHDDSEEFDKEGDVGENKVVRRSFKASLGNVLLWIVTASVVLLSTVNISLLWSKAFPKPLNLDNLPRIHTYIGLNQIAENVNVTFEGSLSVNNHPRFLAQVDSAHPEKVMPEEIRQYYSPAMGTMAPDARRFYVESTISTIARFRVVDYGMERCHIHLNPGPALGNPSKWGWPVPHLTVWRLEDVEGKIDLSKLSWNTKPARHHLLASWELKNNETVVSAPFDCAWGTEPLFEFECEAPGLIDFLDNPREQTPALMLVQKSSLIDH